MVAARSALASWHGRTVDLDVDFVAHGVDARGLGDATQAIGEVTGTARSSGWNDDPGRTLDEVLAAIDRAQTVLAVR